MCIIWKFGVVGEQNGVEAVEELEDKELLLSLLHPLSPAIEHSSLYLPDKLSVSDAIWYS